MASPRAIIFDFDGTIADSRGAFIDVGNQILAEMGRPAMSDVDVELYRGMTIKEALRALRLPFYRLPSFTLRGRALMAQRKDSLEEVPGMVAALQKLHGQGMTLAIVSSNDAASIGAFLGRNGLEGAFSFVSGGASLFSKGKRLQRLLRNLEWQPSEVWYVGDEVRDVEAARGIGMPVCGVAWGLNNEPALLKAGAYAVAESPDELVRTVTELPA